MATTRAKTTPAGSVDSGTDPGESAAQAAAAPKSKDAVNPEGPSDRALAAKAARGHQGAFRELLERYERPVFSLIYRMVRDRALAEDLSQEAFIRAFKAIRSYNPAYKFSSWMFKIANNLTIDHLRRRRIETVAMAGTFPDARAADLPGDPKESREHAAVVDDFLSDLDDAYRDAPPPRHEPTTVVYGVTAAVPASDDVDRAILDQLEVRYDSADRAGT